MFGRSKRSALRDSAASVKDLSAMLARAPVLAGLVADDKKLQRQIERTASSVRKALLRIEKKPNHRLRNVLIVVGAGGVVTAAVVPPSRRWVAARLPRVGGKPTPRTIDTSIEVAVPVSTAYNQWTQFEDFPLFMEGVDHVQQLDDTRLHWAATVAGKRAEWDAKILEQHPDRQISWISDDGKKTRGTVTFEERGEGRTLTTLSMSYQAEGVAEAAGSAAGLDERRVRGDLERFREMIEARGAETGAWRGEVTAGQAR
jgi:uncharacterized membrane protein